MALLATCAARAQPIGFSFSAKQDIEKAVASNGGNAAYKQYYWDDDLIGPKPDFGKGF